MSVILETKIVGPVKVVHRTWRTEIFSVVNEPVIIKAYREELECTEAGAIVVQKTVNPVTRQLANVVTQTVTLTDGVTVLSALQVAEAVERFIEMFAAEDRTSAPPPAP